MTTLQRVVFSAQAEGTCVKLRIGNAEISMSYEDAFKLSQWLRMSGKEAKRNAGDMSRHWSVIGRVTAGELEEGKSHAHTHPH